MGGKVLLLGAVIATVVYGGPGCRSKPSGPAPAFDPLDPPVVLRSNGDFLRAQEAAKLDLTDAFHHFDAGVPLTDADRTNLLRGARLCAAMVAYLPSKAREQDFMCGEALAALGYHEVAIRRYRLFLDSVADSQSSPELNVMRSDAYGLMSTSLTATGKYTEALDAANVALHAFPRTPAYLNDRAIAEIDLGQTSAAKKDLTEAATAAMPDDPAKRKAVALLKTLTAKQ